jgi:MYXO-CTERM domain-containing protein
VQAALKIVVAALVLAGAAPASAGGKDDVVDFSGEVDAVEPVAALPKADVEYQPMLPARYRKRRNQPEPVMSELEDPLPLKPQKRGCGACNAGGAPGPGAGLLALGALFIIGRRRGQRRSQ